MATFKGIINLFDHQDQYPGVGNQEVTVEANNAADAMSQLQGQYGRIGKVLQVYPASSVSSRPNIASAAELELSDFTAFLWLAVAVGGFYLLAGCRKSSSRTVSICGAERSAICE